MEVNQHFQRLITFFRTLLLHPWTSQRRDLCLQVSQLDSKRSLRNRELSVDRMTLTLKEDMRRIWLDPWIALLQAHLDSGTSPVMTLHRLLETKRRTEVIHILCMLNVQPNQVLQGKILVQIFLWTINLSEREPTWETLGMLRPI